MKTKYVGITLLLISMYTVVTVVVLLFAFGGSSIALLPIAIYIARAIILLWPLKSKDVNRYDIFENGLKAVIIPELLVWIFIVNLLRLNSNSPFGIDGLAALSTALVLAALFFFSTIFQVIVMTITERRINKANTKYHN